MHRSKENRTALLRASCTVAALVVMSAATASAATFLQCTIVTLKGEPLRDVEIRLAPEGLAEGTSGKDVHYVKTRGDGRAVFANLQDGTYLLASQRKGYMPLLLKVAAPSEQPLRRTLLTENEFTGIETKANEALKSGDFATAVQHLTQLTGYYPRDAVMHENLARAWAGSEDEEKAMAEAARASELDPSRAFVVKEVRGVLLRTAGEKALKGRDFKLAMEKFEELRDVNPENAAAYHGLALAYGHQRRFPEAIQAINQAIRLRPNDGGLVAIKTALEANAGVR